MINNLNIRGFKCFDDESFSIAPLTLLSGLNSSGKSSFIQAIRLAYGHKNSSNGPLSELVSSLHKNFNIKLISGDREYSLKYPLKKLTDYTEKFPTLISYISADRLGPQLHLPMRNDKDKGRTVGIKGEFVLDFLEYHFELAGLPKTLQIPETKSSGVYNNVAAWLNMISPGIRFEFEPIPKADIIRAEYSGHRPSNVGFGISYTLPIIANSIVYAALIANQENNSALIMLENPEAHLHPAGQTQLGVFLSKVASCGVQLIIETHSDHLLNGIRLAVKDKILEAEKSKFYYFKYDFDEEKSIIHQPILDQDGYFDEWPDGFFDETEKNLERLL